jgi:hypothetical protein
MYMSVCHFRDEKFKGRRSLIEVLSTLDKSGFAR